MFLLLKELWNVCRPYSFLFAVLTAGATLGQMI